MKFAAAAAAAAVLPVLAGAFVIPDTAGEQQAPLAQPAPHDSTDEPSYSSPSPAEPHDGDDHGSSWWDFLPSKEDISAKFDETLGSLGESVEDALDKLDSKMEALIEATAESVDMADGLGLEDYGHPGHGHRRHGHHSFPDATIYQLISESKYTTKFAKVVDEHPSVVKLLNSTKAGNHTVFVPVDAAFDHMPKHHKPSDYFVENALLYHVGLGNYPARRILGTHTIPTALNESFLGGDAQRLRTRVGLGGVSVNFYSKVVATDITAKNGIIHGVRSILVTPPFIGREISLFPDRFSTLLLAFDKTGFGKYAHEIKTVGATLFAPSNHAFSRLGPRANAFLFNSETGLKYLKAILKYHVAPNATLYSDAFYDRTTTSIGSDGDGDGDGTVDAESTHFDLKTLLNDVHVGVDVGRVLGFVTIRVNGFAHVTVQDGVAKNGVVHVLDKVLIPPHKHRHGEDAYATDDIDVDELKERLDDYV